MRLFKKQCCVIVLNHRCPATILLMVTIVFLSSHLPYSLSTAVLQTRSQHRQDIQGTLSYEPHGRATTTLGAEHGRIKHALADN